MSPSNKKKSKAAKHTTIISSSHPLSTDPLPTDYTADFATFIRLADPSDIQHFCEAAASTQDGANLMLFWKRAFDEGRKVGYKEGSQILEGVSVSGLFDQGQMLGIRNERREWETAGHGEACFVKPPLRSEAGAQVNLAPTPPPRIDAAIQTTTDINPSQSITTLSADLRKFDVGTQVELADDPVIPPHLDASIQTTVSPLSPSQPKKTSMPHLDWAEDAKSLPIVASSTPPLSPPSRQSRDLSVLCSSSPAPFSSLQRRAKPSGIRGSHQSRRRHCPFNSDFLHPPIQPRHSPIYMPPSRRRGHQRPSLLKPIVPLLNLTNLDWESDTRLSDLSRALKALGWTCGL
jgi:hypothetical protein